MVTTRAQSSIKRRNRKELDNDERESPPPDKNSFKDYVAVKETKIEHTEILPPKQSCDIPEGVVMKKLVSSCKRNPPLFSTQPETNGYFSVNHLDYSSLLQRAKPGSEMFHSVVSSDDLPNTPLVVLDERDVDDEHSAKELDRKEIEGHNTQRIRGKKQTKSVCVTRAKHKSTTIKRFPLDPLVTDTQPLRHAIQQGTSRQAFAQLTTIAAQLRYVIRMAYQNPASLRMQTLASRNVDVSAHDSLSELIHMLHQCQKTCQSFFVLLLGAPESERSTMVCSAVEALVKELPPEPPHLSEAIDSGWTFLSVVVPAFCTTEAMCLTFLIRSVCDILTSLLEKQPYQKRVFEEFIMTVGENGAFFQKGSNRQQGRTFCEPCDTKISGGTLSNAVNHVGSLLIPLRLKGLTYKKEIRLLKHLFQYLKSQRIIPIVTLEYFKPLVFGGHQNRQTLLYNFFTLVHSETKRLQSRYGLSRIHFYTTLSCDDIAALLPSMFTLPCLPHFPETTSVLSTIKAFLNDASVKDIINFYVALDHRAFEFITLSFAQQLLTLLSSVDYNTSSLIKIKRQDISKEKENCNHPMANTLTGTPIKRRKSTSYLDNSPGNVSSPTWTIGTPTSGLRKNRTAQKSSIVQTPETHSSQQVKPSSPVTVLNTEQHSDYKIVPKLLYLDTSGEYHDILVPQLSLCELLILCVMTYMHKKRIPSKTLSLIMKELRRIEKLSMIAGRSCQELQYNEAVPQRYRLALNRTVRLKLLERSSSHLMLKSLDSMEPVKYPYYTRFLTIYPKLCLPTHVERYLQSA